MGVLQIRPAQREGARVVIGLSGVSGCGKTYTALCLAYGMANGDGKKVGFLDTENKRGSLYADDELYTEIQKQLKLKDKPSPFLIGDLFAPFSPKRYIEAIQEFQAAGVEVLVIDSATHEWEGIGGCLEISEYGNPKVPNWNKAKAEHKKFMNTVLQCDMHIVFCVRAREKDKPEKQMVDGVNKTVFVDMGLQPIQEKNFMFEMTASCMLHDEGKRQDVMKCPSQLREYLGRGQGYLTAADGMAIRDWIDGGKKLNAAVERYRNALQSKTEQGAAAVTEAWEKVPTKIQKALTAKFFDVLLSSAREFDELNKQQGSQSAANGVSALNAAAAAQVPAARQATVQPEKPEPAPQQPADSGDFF